MKKETDIEKFKNKRQLNVQEQNALTQYNIEQTADYFRMHKNLPDILLKYFESQGIDLDKDILICYDRMPYGCLVEGYSGQWLTHNHRFITYLVFLDETDSQIDEVDEWKDITDKIEVNSFTKGKGSSYGQLCVNVLKKMNNNIKSGEIE